MSNPAPPPAPAKRPSALHWTWREGTRYGLLGFGLAFVALPLYVLLPHYYAERFGVPLATLGTLLLVSRLWDAAIDPLLGRWGDRLLGQSLGRVLGWGAAAAGCLLAGFVGLFFPPLPAGAPLLAWAGGCLVLTYSAYSALGILYQAWGAMLGGNALERSTIVAWREGFGVLGVISASVLPQTLGLPSTALVLGAALAAGCWAWRSGPWPVSRALSSAAARPAHDAANAEVSAWHTLRRPGLLALLAVLLVNGVASAAPATLLLFFIQDRLQAPASSVPLFLGTYFVCAAASIVLWLRAVPRWGLERSWAGSMVLAAGVFVGAAFLGAGDTLAFTAVCALSGAALGADLVLPSALLAGTIQANGDQGRSEGRYFGWWNLVSKLSLALAAGVALPALGALGYTPGAQDPQALRALTVAYCLLPCSLKLVAAAMLYRWVLRPTLFRKTV